MPSSTTTATAKSNIDHSRAKRRGTLLVVDDEEGPRQSLRVIFKDDYDLLLADNGPTAIELAQNNKIASYVKKLESSQPEEEPLPVTPPPGDLPPASELVEEIEQFLRRQRPE